MLQGAGLHPFVHGREGDRFMVGLDIDARDSAIEILSTARLSGWYVRWERGRRSGTVALSGAGRRLARATRWEIMSAWSYGDRMVGPESAVLVDLWVVGSSGERELVGTRGLERFSADATEIETEIEGMSVPTRSAFALHNGVESFAEPIDVVYTWVDGQDLIWKSDFDQWLIASDSAAPSQDSVAAGRFRSRDELRYSLRSVHFLCGWIRHIFVVTNGQHPTWLDRHPRVTVVCHNEILPSTALPTFNSHAIEAALHRVPVWQSTSSI